MYTPNKSEIYLSKDLSKNRNYFQDALSKKYIFWIKLVQSEAMVAFAVNLIFRSSSLIRLCKDDSLFRSGLIKITGRMHYLGGSLRDFSPLEKGENARAVRSTREKHRRWAITRAHKNRSRATAYVKKTIRGGALRCCWLAAEIAPVPRKRGLMIEPAPLIYALRHTLHRGFVFRDRLVNKIFCNSGLRHFAMPPSPPPAVCRSFILLLKTVINRLRHSASILVPLDKDGKQQGAQPRNRRDVHAEVIAEIRTAFSCGRTVIRQFQSRLRIFTV